MFSEIKIEFQENEETSIKTLILKNTVFEDDGYYTEWETESVPKIRIINNEDLKYSTSQDIEVIIGSISNKNLDKIATEFNESLDKYLNREVLLNLRILRDSDNLPFNHGLITTESYFKNGNKFSKHETYSTIMNNYNGYIQIRHKVNPKLNDRFLKISYLEISLEIPNYNNQNDKTFSESVEYSDSDGIVKANSNKDDCPYVEIRINHINYQQLIKGLDLVGNLFIGTVL